INPTQTNDYALGVPIVKALYEKVHPEFLPYLYLLAPVNLTILNPFGFIFLELHKSRCRAAGSPESNSYIALNVLRNIVTNPIVFMSMLGMACNFIFHHEPPDLLFKILDVFSSAFSATALFLLGLRMVGKVQTLHGTALIVPGVLIGVKLVIVPLVLRQVVYALLTAFPDNAPSIKVFSSAFSATALFLLGLRMVGKVQTLHGTALIVPGVLIGVKLVIVPLVLRQVVYALLTAFPDNAPTNGTASVEAYSTFAFLYGTVPSAPGVFVYATSYNLDVELIASSMVACTFLSAPIMFVSARLISLTTLERKDYEGALGKFNTDICVVSLFACVWLVTSFLCQKNSRSRHLLNRLVNLLVISRICAILAYLSIQYLDRPHHTPPGLVERFINVFGDFSTLVIIPCLALAVLLTVCHNFTLLVYLRPYFYILYMGLPVFYYLVSSFIHSPPPPTSDPNDTSDPIELAVQNLALFLALLVTVVCLVLTQRQKSKDTTQQIIEIYNKEDRIQLVPWDQLSFETRHVCDQFIGYHLRQCRTDIARDIRWKLLLYKQCFTGEQFISWLLAHDIAQDRGRGLEYAQHLVQGRVIRHIQGAYAFQDSRHKLYTFVPSANCTRR
ncbi:integral membrane protein GPR155, partial [Diaphorina citri]|uniref:Integral membrane protein GPR155 n=1 Tax=Diaphorina citri TaxID=121845 RepID=A0A3Q0J692_DIACI